MTSEVLPSRSGPTDRPQGAGDLLPLELTALGLAVAGFAARIPLLRVRYLDPDELEHLHAGWCLAKGLLPGRGFFDQHPPGIWILLAPVLAALRPERDFEAARAAIVAGRVLMLLLTGVLLLLVHRLGNRLGGRPIGALAVALTSGFVVFVEKSLEIRPDVLSTPLWAGSLLLLVASLDDAGRGARSFTASGILFGTAFFFGTQKIAFAFPGLAVGLLAHILASKDPRPPRARWAHILFWGGGALVPGLVLLGGFAAFGAARDLVELYLVNLRWTNRMEPWDYLTEMFRTNALLISISVLALAWTVFGLAVRRSPLRHAGILVSSLAGIGLGVALIPEVHPHYYLPAWPLFAILTASLIVRLAGAVRPKSPGGSWDLRDTLTLAAGLGLFLVLHRGNVPDVHRALAWFDSSPLRDLALTLVASGFLHFRRGPGLVLVALALASTPYRQVRLFFRYQNTAFLEAMRYVHETTSPSDRCLDGYSGFVAFRPHTLRYFAATTAICNQIPNEEKDQLLEGLRTGSIAPALIIVDGNLRALSPKLEEVLADRYQRARRDCPLYSPTLQTNPFQCATTWRLKDREPGADLLRGGGG